MRTHIGTNAEPVQFFFQFFLVVFVLCFYGVWHAAAFSPLPARSTLSSSISEPLLPLSLADGSLLASMADRSS
jgi:hypothetical protein